MTLNKYQLNLRKAEQRARSALRRRRNADMLARYRAGDSITAIALHHKLNNSWAGRIIHRELTRA